METINGIMDRPTIDVALSVSERVRASWSTLRLHIRAKAGDQSALNALFARQWSPLMRWAHGRLPRWARSRIDTADLVQDAMLVTFRRLDAFEVRGRSALRAYLQQAIQNRICDELRRVARAPAGTLSPHVTDAAPSPLETLLSQESEHRYKRAIGRLRPEERELIVGRFELEYSFDQLALATRRRTAGAARVALGRALARLAAEMARE